MTRSALRAGYALVAAGNLKGTKGCWESNDVPVVADWLSRWRIKHQTQVPKSTPLFLLGPSSGGYFATQAARQWHEVRALSVQVFVPPLDDMKLPLPGGAAAFPPLQLILMPRDTSKLKSAAALPPTTQVLTGSRPRVHPGFFSDGIEGLSSHRSHALQKMLLATKRIDASTLQLVTRPSRGTLHDEVRAALLSDGRKHNPNELPGHSLQMTMDAIFARLDMAYAYHASTCEYINATLAFFANPNATATMHSGVGTIRRSAHTHTKPRQVSPR